MGEKEAEAHVLIVKKLREDLLDHEILE